MTKLVFDFGGKELAPGESTALDDLWLSAGSSPNALLEAYLTATARPRPLPERSPHGWWSSTDARSSG